MDKSIVIEWLQINQCIRQKLEDEFNSLLEDDKDFNYNENEFLDWVYDYVINVYFLNWAKRN